MSLAELSHEQRLDAHPDVLENSAALEQAIGAKNAADVSQHLAAYQASIIATIGHDAFVNADTDLGAHEDRLSRARAFLDKK